MAGSIPALEIGILNKILDAIKSNGGAIVGLGAMLAQMNSLLVALLKQGGMSEAELEKIQADLDKLVADFASADVASFKPTIDSITKQETPMAKVHSFASGSGTLLDDDKGIIHANPLEADGVTPAPLGSMVPAYSADVTTFGTLDPTVDPTGATCAWTSTKGQAGVTNVTVSGTNPDGTTATGVIVITTTLDPAEQDVASFGPTLDTITKQ